MGVLVQNRQRDRLGLDRDRSRLGDLDLHGFAGADYARALGEDARDMDRALLDQLLKPGPGEVRAGGHEKQIQARARRGLADLEPADQLRASSTRPRRERTTSMAADARATRRPMNWDV